MNFHILFALFLTLTLHCVSALSINDVLETFQQIGAHITSLDKSVKDYEPGLEDKLQIERQHVTVELGLIQATKNIYATEPFDDKDSKTVTNAATQMQPAFETYLHDVVDKRPGFREANLADRIRKHIQEFHDRCHALSYELRNKVVLDDRKVIEDSAKEIDQEFNRALQAYS
ncbi:hydrophobic surface binding protein A-domain-containing protein [Aspergillus coremiiformis]|uniref:Hydrophobic surface binding protein A-domain-containing protein n=1 Tax=Aspergillus coremiiformis TaxID=138285 RepID=A0A5N6Z318_9EURO|nr:hydrophobic surface binding protein A-domain-containing protein [Aspergillus coremiiformis]